MAELTPVVESAPFISHESLVNILFPIPIDASMGRQLWFSLHLPPNLKVLDIGGGQGWITHGYPGTVQILDDFSGVAPKDKPNIPEGAIQGDAHNIAQVAEKEEYDVAIVGELIEHLTDPEHVLREAARVAKQVLISTPYEFEWGYGKPAFEVGGHMRQYTKGSFQRVLEAAGLEYRICKLVCSGWVFWMAQAWQKGKPIPRDELKYWADMQAHGIRFWVIGDLELYVATKETRIMDLDGGIYLRIPIKRIQAHQPTENTSSIRVEWRTWPERDREPL